MSDGQFEETEVSLEKDINVCQHNLHIEIRQLQFSKNHNFFMGNFGTCLKSE